MNIAFTYNAAVLKLLENFTKNNPNSVSKIEVSEKSFRKNLSSGTVKIGQEEALSYILTQTQQ